MSMAECWVMGVLGVGCWVDGCWVMGDGWWLMAGGFCSEAHAAGGHGGGGSVDISFLVHGQFKVGYGAVRCAVGGGPRGSGGLKNSILQYDLN